jgi:KUP system potassium uptake protein
MRAKKTGMAALAVGALGVVFGDIGTSPLYAVQAISSPLGQRVAINKLDVYGVISLIVWSVTMIVSIKFLGFIMRADNKGEGGIMALVALIKSSGITTRYKWFLITLGLVGVALFYGDSAITPAISVLSAVEGLKVVAPSLHALVLPVTLVILTGLFWLQKYGTGLIGRLFGPVMVLWFLAIAIGGGWQIWQHPDILHALSPVSAIRFFVVHPLVAFVAMGAVTLAITGAEALYADMGHFGRKPIARAWFFVVFPALLLCYMGQGSLLLHSPASAGSPFLSMFPHATQVPMIFLATAATLIASQSVISGAFSLTRQAIQLDFMPKMLVRHTSARSAGQIYLPVVNLALFVSVAVLVLLFGSSEKLANAYGLAVSGTLTVDTILFIAVVRGLWHRSRNIVAGMVVVFLSLDLLLFSSNVSKLFHGGWFPALIAILIFVLIRTWQAGQHIISRERRALEGPLKDLVDVLHFRKPPITRVPGYAIYISHHPGFAPLAFHATIEEIHELAEKVVVVYVQVTDQAHIPNDERAVFDSLEYDDGISSLSLSYGFHDVLNIPKTLKGLRHLSPELDFDPTKADYFVSLSKVVTSKRHNLAGWRKTLYRLMARNASSPSDYYKLPADRTIEMSTLIKL